MILIRPAPASSAFRASETSAFVSCISALTYLDTLSNLLLLLRSSLYSVQVQSLLKHYTYAKIELLICFVHVFTNCRFCMHHGRRPETSEVVKIARGLCRFIRLGVLPPILRSILVLKFITIYMWRLLCSSHAQGQLLWGEAGRRDSTTTITAKDEFTQR